MHERRRERRARAGNLIGPQVERLRVRAGLHRSALCRLLGVHGLEIDVRALGRIERRKRRVRDHEVLAFARALRVEPEVLFPEELR
jgi:transcriptional regulator with XRE-family HTH domain